MKDIHWLVNRLKSMNAPEVAWRVQQKLLQKKEKKIVYALHLPVTQIPLSKGLQGLRADAYRIPFNSQNNNTSVFETLDIFGQFDYQLFKKKWNAGFQTENTWPEKDFSADISIGQREDIGDIRTNWELNRHFQFSCLAKNYYLTGKKEYLDELVDLFEDWNNHNLFLHGAEWTSAMELGIRVNSWIYTYVFLAHAYEKYQEKKYILNELAHGILVMTEYIIKHRAKFSSANNHLIVEIFAVGMAGILFDKKEWIKLAVGILTEELPKQNYEDGVNKEMSLHYQGFVMEAYGLLWLALEKNKYEVPQSWKLYLSHMSEYMADCCGDFGEIVVFGDNDEGKLLDLQGKIEDHYRYVLQLMGMLLDQRYTDLPLVENVSWITSKEQQEQYNKKKLYESKLVAHYKKGGYTVLRSRDHKVLIGMDHAELGFGSIAAHGHADALSIQAFHEGKPVLVDSGTYNYHVPKSVRNEIRSAKAHNTVYVEGIEQAEMLGPFLWGKRYKVENVAAKKKEGCVEIDATISYSGITHRRKITFDFERKLVVEDFVDGTEKAVQVWLLASKDIVRISRTDSDRLIYQEQNRLYSESYSGIGEATQVIFELKTRNNKTYITFEERL